MVWCCRCYRRDKLDKSHIDEPSDDDGAVMYNDESDEHGHKIGIDGAHLMLPFQCDLCLFRTLFLRNPRKEIGDKETLIVIRRINLDIVWAREPSTIQKNIGYLKNLIATCESSGFSPQLPALGPFPLKDDMGIAIAFSMIIQSLRPGRHRKTYTQFVTIRKQRSAFNNLYNVSVEAAATSQVLAIGSQSSGRITACSTNSIWFSCWVAGCETRMGFVLKQNKAISIEVMLGLVKMFKRDIKDEKAATWERQHLCLGLSFSVIAFAASLRGSEGLKVDLAKLRTLINKGLIVVKPKKKNLKLQARNIPHVILPLRGCFKGEKGERCHLIALSQQSQ